MAPHCPHLKMITGKKGSYLQQLNVNTGVISCQWGNTSPADTCRGQYGAEYSFTQNTDEMMENEFDYSNPEGLWSKFLNDERVKAVSSSVLAETELGPLLEECGGDKKSLRKLLQTAMKNTRDNSCNEKNVKRFQNPVLGPDFAAGKTGKAGEHKAGLTTQLFLDEWLQYYNTEEENESKKNAGLLGINEKLLPALEASYKKQWPLKVNLVRFLDSHGEEMTYTDVARYVHWTGAKININLHIKKLRFVQVGQITHFSPEYVINSVTVLQNGPEPKSMKARTFSAIDCLSKPTQADDDDMSDSEILTHVEETEHVEKKRRASKKKKANSRVKSSEFVDAD